MSKPTSADRCVNPTCGGYANRYRSAEGYCHGCEERKSITASMGGCEGCAGRGALALPH